MATPGTLPPSEANFRMIDVGGKADTRRRALASGSFFAKRETIQLIKEKRIPKGDVLLLAEVAGIQGAKNTAQLLPLCHPLPLHSVRVWSEVLEGSIRVYCEASTVGKTGVEMEALTGVNIALLCIYDLTKIVDPCLRLGDIQLDVKEGGKSGVWTNPNAVKLPAMSSPKTVLFLAGKKICFLTVSDRCSRQESEDVSGIVLRDWALAQGSELSVSAVVPDEVNKIVGQVTEWIETLKPDLIITTGGTGLSPRDRTPEAFQAMVERWQGREIPGVGELLRKSGAAFTPMSWLSRSLGIEIANTFAIALPGSPKAVREGLTALEPLFSHLLHIGKGGDHVGHHKLR